KADILHIMAHGRFEENLDSMRSALLLGDGEQLPSKLEATQTLNPSMLLTASALMAFGRISDHLTLHSCSMGRSRAGGGDELWGMVRAALAAGASSVLAPLWDVELSSSTHLLTSFYNNWLIDGMSKPHALSEAQRQQATRTDLPEWSHFYHWGPFQY